MQASDLAALSRSLSLPPNGSLADYVLSLPAKTREAIIRELPEPDAAAIEYDWRGFWARPSQLQPPGAWTYWLVQAGRGFGKTRTGAETVREWASHPLPAPIHLVAPTASDIRKVMVEGMSGLLSCYPPGEAPIYEPSLGHKLTWPNGNVAYCFSADEPERLRGPQCCRFWADELAAWRFAQEAWDNLIFGFRIGENLRGVITTTPKPIDLIRELRKDPATVITHGSTYENRNWLAKEFYASVIRKYEGTRLGRQELMAELLEDIPGALWTRALIDKARVQLSDVPALVRVVIAIDPAVTAGENSDETGIGAAGVDRRGHIYVLEDISQRSSPHTWAREACKLFLKWKADRMVAEVNNGGDLVEANLRAIHPAIPYRAVRASRGKMVRAEPAAALYEQGRVHHVREADLALLEDQLCSWVPGQQMKSPDRMDWLVWAITDLVITPAASGIIVVDPGYQISPI